MSKRGNLFSISVFIFFLFIQSIDISATVPAGYYYYAKNKKQADLKTALNTYCKPLRELDYGGNAGFTWEGFYFTDRNADNSIIDMYSDSVRYFSGFSSVQGMHIEHSFPKSWWGGYDNGAYKDLFHLYPADALTNSTKNDLPLGEVTGTPTLYNGKSKIGKNGFGTTYAGNCFEPADEYKGDFARSYFYIATVYQELYPLFTSPMLDSNSYPVWKNWALDLLMKWHLQDPVSPKELARIEAVYNIQGNRNPFIDYPDLADYIWGNNTANNYPFPEETEPFLLTPRPGNKMDLGVILSGDTRTQNIRIQGVNLNSDLQVTLLKNAASLQLSTTTVSQANALAGIDISLTFSPSEGGLVRDTLLISGGGLGEILRIPVKALASVDFIALEPTNVTPVSGELQWIADPVTENYRLNVYQGDNAAGDLIISAYVEGSSWNKAIELYNGTGKTIYLSKYSLQKQSNGAGSFGSTLRLSGTLESGKSYLIVHKQAGVDLMSKQNLLTDTLLQFNGNDAICLVHGGVTIDMVGQANAGASVSWGENVTLERKSSVTHPLSVFNPNEWNTYGTDVFSMLGNHTMNLTPHRNNILEVVLPGKTTSYYLPGLMPENTYTYKIESLRSGVYVPAVNTMQLHTLALDVPVIMESSDILTTQFTANWEQTLYVSDYLLNVFTIKGQTDSTETEGFDNVGTSGTPLPTGWSGTASGNYTTATSSGLAAPSVALKNNGEWLQTKIYPQPVSKFAFMYRYPSASIGSSFIIDGLNNDNWIRVDSIPYKGTTAKIYPVYNFTTSQNLTAFRFTYKKVGNGNLAIDDVEVTYGNQDTVFVLKNHSVTGEEFIVNNIESNTLYYYNVRAAYGISVSAFSEIATVRTLIDTRVQNNFFLPVKIHHIDNQLHISDLKGNETIRIYNTAGICMNAFKANASEMIIPFRNKGVFIVNVYNGEYKYTGKIIAL